MSLLATLRLLAQCPAILRIGADVIIAIANAIDRGLDDEAANRAREAAVSRARAIAAGRAAKASSDATTERMRRGPH